MAPTGAASFAPLGPAVNQAACSATRSEVHIVVTCANRKLCEIPRELRLQAVPPQHQKSRFDAWTHRLTASSIAPVPAAHLYGGEHWQVARTLGDHAAASGYRASTWVCSAGYGLVPLTAALRPYAATFAVGHPDSAGHTTTAIQEWWTCHTAWPGPAANAPRSFTALAASAPHAAFLVVLSAAYLRACAPDLRAVAAELDRPEQLAILSVGGSATRGLGDYLLPADAHLQTVVGGSLGALNVHLAARLLQTGGADLFNRHVLAEHLRALARGGSRRQVPKRAALTDGEVRAFIAERLTERSTHTGLLRQLRDAGLACEQQRFARLFAATVGGR
jgi:hypothetical protein